MVGIFDSGVGGLSVLKAVRAVRKDVCIRYVADQANVPYGPRPLEEVRGFASGIAKFLISERAALVVVACNAASAAALYSLREDFPDTPFVGMEPAVKPAATQSISGVVGVLATPATFQGKLYASVIERFAANVKVLTSDCPGLVQRIEQGDLDGPATRSILEQALGPMMDAGADTIVLGCTHYPFVIPLVQSIVGTRAKVIDPSPAVARQVDKILKENGQPTETCGETLLFTTGDAGPFDLVASSLLGETLPISSLKWDRSSLLPL
jgi:glutamate racemase